MNEHLIEKYYGKVYLRHYIGRRYKDFLESYYFYSQNDLGRRADN